MNSPPRMFWGIGGMAGSAEGPIGRCASCHNDLRARARFCDVCGSAVAPPSVQGEYKQVTVLFADVVGSMRLAASLRPERLQAVMHELLNRSAAVVQRFQGTVAMFTGDGLMALFGAPMALEDHALRACICALEIQSVTKRLAAELQHDGIELKIRVGLNSGEVVAGEVGSGPGAYTAVGHPVGMAQRMESAAPPGGVLCSLSTARLVENSTSLGPIDFVAVKGADEPLPARQLLAVELDRKVLGRNEGVLLGRHSELGRLCQLFDASQSCLIGIVGAAGLGKSRLAAEFSAIAAARHTDIVLARCEAHTTEVAFRVLSRLLRALFDVHGLGPADARRHTVAQMPGLASRSADAQILFEAMGIGDPSALPPQVSVAGRRSRLVAMLSEALSVRPRRTVFVLEDAHWIDAPSDDILAGFAASLDTISAMFLVTYRPEFRGALQQFSDHTIVLRPLSDSEAVRMVRQLVGDDVSLAGLAERIADAAAGNPYFIEEIVRDLAGNGQLSGNRGSYRLIGDISEITVPATIQAVLSARIDRLHTETKSVLNTAAVIGTRFDVAMLQALRPETSAAQLAELVSAELIDQSEFVPQQRYCFRHPLVRAVTYESQLSSTRARTHREIAATIHARNPDAADENAALIATHLEAAGELADAHRWHMRAAEWLRFRDLPAARAQWGSARRISDRLPDDRDGVLAMRIAPRTLLMSTMLYVGEEADTDVHFRELRQLAMAEGDLESFAIGAAGRLWSYAYNGNRYSETISLAAELDELTGSIECAPSTMAIILNSLAFVRFADCDFDAVLKVLHTLESLSIDVAPVELAPALTLRGVIELCLGESAKGRRHLHEGIARASAFPVIYYASIQLYSGFAAALGIYPASGLIEDGREALRRAESLGDAAAIICAQFAYGTALLRADATRHEEAIDVLGCARTTIEKHRLGTLALAVIDADLAVYAAHKGRRDEAIDELRRSFAAQLNGFRSFAGYSGEALVGLLIDRGSVDDLAEAHRVVDQWQDRRPGIPAFDLWWLKARALLAEAEGDHDGYVELAGRYLGLCESLDAHGRLAEARRLVQQSGDRPRMA